MAAEKIVHDEAVANEDEKQAKMDQAAEKFDRVPVGRRLSFEEAADKTFAKHREALRELAK
jgi:hypothetical protein